MPSGVALPVPARPHGGLGISLLVEPLVGGNRVPGVALPGVVPPHKDGAVDPHVFVLQVPGGWSGSDQEREDANSVINKQIVLHLHSVVGQDESCVVVSFVDEESSEDNTILVFSDLHWRTVGVGKDTILDSVDDVVRPSLGGTTDVSGTSKASTLTSGSSVVSELRIQGLLELITAMLVEVYSLILMDPDKSDNKFNFKYKPTK